MRKDIVVFLALFTVLMCAPMPWLRALTVFSLALVFFACAGYLVAILLDYLGLIG